ncbi:substrate-binding domain-containing protein [Paenibacillus cremeus]|uniref:LacI family transcriptional regulator n=1 Tax=Paenibacillus cremeus TaxID=2163881 RepID=A0A559KGW3_9BACL|nr:substrate-binding domain-containing protein [Paenibacillus cremeus]TVY11318.1 LacI family transcriptional regulator [Paenibacillus cremeus]
MNERQNEILQLLKKHAMMKIHELSEQLNVSPATIRRDLTELSKAGVERVGGAAFLTKPSLPGDRTTDIPSDNQVGCIVSVSISSKHMYPYFSPILEGIEKGLAKFGYSLAFMHNLDDIQNEAILQKMVHDYKHIRGMIVVEGIKPEVYELIKKHFPYIVGIDISDSSVPVIAYDRVAAASSAVRHLLDQGHKKIGFIGGAGLTGEMEREKRYRGYKLALQEAGLDLNPNWVINAEWDVNKSYSGMLDMFKRNQDLPTAMFSASDMMAMPAMRAATEIGLRIPEDMAFIGLDNIELSQYTSPPLSSIHIPKAEIGMVAAKTLIDYLQGAYPLPFKMLMPYQVIARQSSTFQR